MNVKFKSALIIFSTLIVGIAIGVAAGPLIFRAFVEKSPPQLRSEMIVRNIERNLELTNEQKAAIEPILTAHAQRIIDMNNRHRDELGKEMDSLATSLNGLVSDSQLENLKSKRFGPRGPREGRLGH